MSDENNGWGLIEWAFTAGSVFVSFVIGYLTLFLSKKWNSDIDKKIHDYHKRQLENRVLREDKYKVEANNLNEKIEGLIDKIDGLNSEITCRQGVLDRIKDAENNIKNLEKR